jgi:LemA protein
MRQSGKTIWIVLGVLVLMVVLGFGWYKSGYDKAVRYEQSAKKTWSDVDAVLQRRFDLIPNLVSTVKGYAAHETELFQSLAQSREKYFQPGSGPAEKIQASNQLSGLLSRLLVLKETYPDLKANQNFLALQEELTSTENKISFSRQAYNDQVLFFNNKIQMFPSNVIAGMFQFKTEDFFELENKSERETPKVQF